jgi:hypothetical protein
MQVHEALRPKQDWMVLEPMVADQSKLILPSTYDATDMSKRKDLQAFTVLAIGPWKEIPVMDKWIAHGIQVNDVVMIEGIGFGVVEYAGKKYAVSRAANVIYDLMDHTNLISVNEIAKKGGLN